MYYRFGKAFYFLSIILFVFFLLYFYSALPEKVGYNYGDNGLSPGRLDKGTFFYGMAAMFMVLNITVLLPPKLLETKNHNGLVRIFPKGDNYRDYFLGWFYSFGGIINVSLALMVFYTHSINNQNEIQAGEFSFFFYLVPVLLVLWILGLSVILIEKFKQTSNKF